MLDDHTATQTVWPCATKPSAHTRQQTSNWATTCCYDNQVYMSIYSTSSNKQLKKWWNSISDVTISSQTMKNESLKWIRGYFRLTCQTTPISNTILNYIALLFSVCLSLCTEHHFLQGQHIPFPVIYFLSGCDSPRLAANRKTEHRPRNLWRNSVQWMQ